MTNFPYQERRIRRSSHSSRVFWACPEQTFPALILASLFPRKKDYQAFACIVGCYSIECNPLCFLLLRKKIPRSSWKENQERFALGMPNNLEEDMGIFFLGKRIRKGLLWACPRRHGNFLSWKENQERFALGMANNLEERTIIRLSLLSGMPSANLP